LENEWHKDKDFKLMQEKKVNNKAVLTNE